MRVTNTWRAFVSTPLAADLSEAEHAFDDVTGALRAAKSLVK